MSSKYFTPNNIISVASGFLVLVLVVFAFILSFDAIERLAVDMGIDGRIAGLLPLMIDGTIFVASLQYIRAVMYGEDYKFSVFLIVMGSLFSVAFNLGHSFIDAGVPVWAMNGLVHLAVPLFLALVIHQLTEQVKSVVTRSAFVKTIEQLAKRIEQAKVEVAELIKQRTAEQKAVEQLVKQRTAEQAKVNELTEQANTLSANIERLKEQQAAEQAKTKRPKNVQVAPNKINEQLLEIVREDKRISQRKLAERLGCSPSTVSGRIKRLKSAGVLAQVANGNGLVWNVK